MRANITVTLLALVAVLVPLAVSAPTEAQTLRRRYLPLVARDPATCPSTGQGFDAIPTTEVAPSLPPNVNPDLNLTVRGWVANSAPRALVDYSGGTDPLAPQLYSLFANDRTPSFTSTHAVYDWDWANNRRGPLLSQWPATLLGMGTTTGEVIRLPRRAGSDIYQGVYYALVVYAERTRISLHYARNDYIAPGYGLHIENVCVDPSLLALYQQTNAAGRGQLPGLRNNQPVGTAQGGEILVAVRDTGTFMDPRSRKDWWAGRAAAAAVVDPRDHTTPHVDHTTPR